MGIMKFDVLTIFPDLFKPFGETSIIKRGQEAGLIEVKATDIRGFAEDKHRTVDDTPYGGGPGMIMRIEPIYKALEALNFKFQNPNFNSISNDSMTKNPRRRVVVLSARGERFDQRKAEEYAKLDQLVLICGRYEGIDQRVADHLADEEISIGEYVLAGGEVAAMVVMEAVARLVPGVLGNAESLKEESFSLASGAAKADEAIVEYPQYTKPEEFNGWKVPEVLLSGDHEAIKKWREENRK